MKISPEDSLTSLSYILKVVRSYRAASAGQEAVTLHIFSSEEEGGEGEVKLVTDQDVSTPHCSVLSTTRLCRSACAAVSSWSWTRPAVDR